MSARSFGWAKWVLAPFWAAEVFSAAKTCDVNPILGDPGLNRRGLHVWRGRLAHRIAERRRGRLAGRVSAADAIAFERDGMIVRPDFVPPELFARMLAELKALCGDAIETLEGDTVNRRIPLAGANLKQLPACRELIRSAAFQHLVRFASGFDLEPSLSIQCLFSKAVRGKPDHQTRPHMDTFHPTAKAWLFLEEVREPDGPFTYAAGSHRRTPRRDAWERRMSLDAADPATPSRGGSFRIDDKALRRIGHRPPAPVTVAPNTLVVADTYGFHARGVSAGPGVRVAIYATGRPNPFWPWVGVELKRLEPLRRIVEGLAGLRPATTPPGVRRVCGVSPWTPPEPWPKPAKAAASPSAASSRRPASV